MVTLSIEVIKNCFCGGNLNKLPVNVEFFKKKVYFKVWRAKCKIVISINLEWNTTYAEIYKS